MRFVAEEPYPITLQYITAYTASLEALANPWISKSDLEDKPNQRGIFSWLPVKVYYKKISIF